MGKKKKKNSQRSRIVDDDEVHSREGVVNGDGGIGDSGEYDLFDKLPEAVICSIVSLLPFKDAVATSVLSKEWASRWKTCLCMDLDLDTFSRQRWRRPYTQRRDKLRDVSFVAWVDFVLGCHQGKELQTFRVSCALNKAYSGCIDRWVAFALRKRVSTMVIDLEKYVYVEDEPEYKYVFAPDVLPGCRSFLKHLTLKGVSLGDLNFACFESLESLTLESTTVSQELVDDILSKCVHLLTLSIVTCHCPSSILEFRFPPDHPLKRLNFSKRTRRIISSIYYFLPGIHMESSLGSPECMFNIIPSSMQKNTKTVSLFQYSWLDEIETVSLTFGEPAHDAPLLQSLRLSVYTKDKYSWDLLHGFGALSPPPLPDFSILRCVSIRGHNFSSLSVMITWLLQAAPALHTLELYWECREKSLLTTKNTNFRKKYFRWRDHENLKVVKVFGFHYCQSNLDILVKILESAPNLADLQFHGSDGHYHFSKTKKWLAEKNVPSEQKVRFVAEY
uniref:F-box domain-containing protein n=1 Tax=Kalanchoe fedtschenkoi TaxID=63787 RepID=A0A7N0V047_KALFE